MRRYDESEHPSRDIADRMETTTLSSIASLPIQLPGLYSAVVADLDGLVDSLTELL